MNLTNKFGEQNKSNNTDKLVYIKLKNFCSLKDTLVALDEENNIQKGWNICKILGLRPCQVQMKN